MTYEKSNPSHWTDKVLIAGVLLLIFTPLIMAVVQTDQLVSKREKRKLASLPQLPVNVADVKVFPERFNDYYSDHFGLRESLYCAYRELWFALGDRPSEKVLVGKNDWLFLGKRKTKKFLDPVGFARNERLFSQHQLQTMAGSYQKRSQKVRERGADYLLVIAPSKSSIYFEEMPAYIKKLRNESATDQFVSYLRQHTDVLILDLRPALLKAKRDQQVYYKVDTHWNHHGANIAQFEIMKVLAGWFPGKIKPEKFSMMDLRRRGGDLGNLTSVWALMNYNDINPRPVFDQSCEPEILDTRKEGELRVMETHCQGESLTLLVFRDSFFSALEPYFARKFKHTVVVWGKPGSSAAEHYLRTVKPDVFIEQWAERNLDYRMRKDPREEPGSEQGY
jgi:alginate O-acetyltransferase complex protein AlgJ